MKKSRNSQERPRPRLRITELAVGEHCARWVLVRREVVVVVMVVVAGLVISSGPIAAAVAVFQSSGSAPVIAAPEIASRGFCWAGARRRCLARPLARSPFRAPDGSVTPPLALLRSVLLRFALLCYRFWCPVLLLRFSASVILHSCASVILRPAPFLLLRFYPVATVARLVRWRGRKSM